MLARAGETERALEFSTYVLNHTASTQDAKDRADQLRANLESQSTRQQIEAVRAQTKTFEAVVEEILAGG
jgi:hypothetical protein